MIGSVFGQKNAFFGHWSEAVRRTESDILREACRLEEEAVAAIEKAIS
ncbi:MAG: hypothetical protein IT210_24135 [Armatimonadetes bacterium]|nr:hypothetical protein [Armatimonadota bacterium]